MTWQPIETAPERLPVIVCCESLFQGREPIVGEAYRDERGDWWWAGTTPGDYYADPISETNGPLTHWMPLPAPPEVEVCTEPNRAECSRLCMDFCNRAEEAADTRYELTDKGREPSGESA